MAEEQIREIVRNEVSKSIDRIKGKEEAGKNFMLWGMDDSLHTIAKVLSNVDWEQRRYELAKSAMQSLFSLQTEVPKGMTPNRVKDILCQHAVDIADTMIEKLNKNEL